MMYKSLLFPALASLACAESTVTSMFMYGADTQPLAASIVGNDATATTYSINCPPGTDGSDCGMGPGLTLIAASPSTTYIMEDKPEFYWTVRCSVGDSTAVCTDTAGGPEANFPGTSTATTDVSLMPVTITAGSITSASDSEPTSTSASESSSSSSSESDEATSTSSASESSETPSGTTSQTETGSESDPTGAAAKVNGVVGMVVGGAAVAFMGAAI
ncbi:putative GPI anchored protein [Aspergillus stella-maris]|uniref:putative GPI anchored protein n=1 Tax=Aspergillus stella-maris TaxID=1810926 RepID=UPI003CCE4B04